MQQVPAFHASTRLHRKIVGMEHRVERMTMRVAKSGAHSYFDACIGTDDSVSQALFVLFRLFGISYAPVQH